jgi:VRR-NUC domain
MKEEQALVHSVMTWLELAGILHYRVRNTGTIIHRPGGVVFGRDRYWRSQLGAPDILAWRSGKSYALELKSKAGRVRPEQTTWLQRFATEGGTAVVVRSLEEVQELFGNKIK